MRTLLIILRDVSTERFHAAYFTEAPFPGPDTDPVIRFRSRGHHTVGADDMEGALKHLDELKEKIPDAIVIRDLVQDFEAASPACHVLLTPEELRAAS